MQEWGFMTGLLPTCIDPSRGEEFGHRIVPAPDINHDGIQDFFLERYRCERPFVNYARPQELLLYYGKKRQLPKPEDGQRIGPKELDTETHITGIGDFDADGYLDLACRFRLLYDTAEGNVISDYLIGYVAIYWGNATGLYSNDDTSHLDCAYPRWIIPNNTGFGEDVNHDGVADVSIYLGAGFEAGKVKRLPHILTYFGQAGERWGRKGKGRQADWSWFAPPDNNDHLWRFDHDCDGYKDWVFVSNHLQTIAIAYGSNDAHVVDTNNIQAISLRPVADGWTLSATFSDLTGDAIPELQVLAGSESNHHVLIYAGKPGQRLIEQFGPGKDSLDKANGRFPLRPWARIAMPHTLNSAWNNVANPAHLLGDLNKDGADEVAVFCSPFLSIYTSGRSLDSLIDLVYQYNTGFDNITRLGDIDGSGTPTYAVTHSGRVHFLKAPPKDDIPTYGGRLRLLPHPVGFRCQHASSVPVERQQEPASGEMNLSRWESPKDGFFFAPINPRQASAGRP
ncbi:MAG: hypothetical protein IPM61_09810 [Chlorobi bacterium]|nr:hypothetical protein [Chlorobiota bacterium]